MAGRPTDRETDGHGKVIGTSCVYAKAANE
jgi:hypothetical protein